MVRGNFLNQLGGLASCGACLKMAYGYEWTPGERYYSEDLLLAHRSHAQTTHHRPTRSATRVSCRAPILQVVALQLDKPLLFSYVKRRVSL